MSELSRSSDTSRGGPRRKRGTKLNEAILEACLDELADSAYRDLTVQAVARRAKTGKASIYRRWPGKRELVRDALTSMLAHVDDGPGFCAGSEGGTVRQSLLDYMTNISGFVGGPHGGAIRSMMAETVYGDLRDAALDRQLLEPWTNCVAAQLRAGIDRGEFLLNAPAHRVAEVLLAAVMQRVLFTAPLPQANDNQAILDVVVPKSAHTRE